MSRRRGPPAATALLAAGVLAVTAATAAGEPATATPAAAPPAASPATVTPAPPPAAPATVTPAPPAAASLVARDEAGARAMVGRLGGHRARLVDLRLHVDDVAGEGRPWLGTVERRGRELWLVGDGFALALDGPLARPRIAGPGYTVWVTGRVAAGRLRARRVGVLAPPPR